MDSISIYMMRHGDTGYGGRYIGSSDVDVSEKGLKQLKAMQSNIHGIAPQKVFVSPMKRCLQSLNAIGLSKNKIVIPELREIDFGQWEGSTFAEVNRDEPEKATEWVNNPSDFIFPKGESIRHFRKRMEYVKKLLDAEKENVFILAHGGVIRSLICLLLGIGQENYLLFNVMPARITEITYFREGGTLNHFNASKLE